jgi:hypothetical protein
MPEKPPVAAAQGSQAPAPLPLTFGQTVYRVKAADQRASGAGLVSAYFQERSEAETFALWLQAQGGRFTLIRLEASREALLPAP